ncbi:MAG: endonuclease III domain-containing protein, partial [Candidatus Marinimicrobia bacterium]|nr:endonuclease III domain-containing protein [Candidatus Neomarinimicrobiota bacterium]
MPPSAPTRRRLLAIYRCLLKHLGPRHWWPGNTPLEVVVGAVLTQNTAWTNVEKAITNLGAAGALDFDTLRAMPAQDLASLIRPAGYFNLKAKRLKSLISWLDQRCAGDLARLAQVADWRALRRELLAVWGIGPETADSILLYALGKPSFVVDAYTRRIFSRLGHVPDDISYEELRAMFTEKLPPDLA